MAEEKKAPRLVPGLYRILPKDPLDITRSPGGIIKPIAPDPPLYATAPENAGTGSKEENLGPVTLNGALGGNARQIWQVKVVNEAQHIYNINRADGVYLPPEHAPTFGIDGAPQDRKPISCIRFADGDPNPNQFQWKILPSPPADSWLQQAMFSIIPVPPQGQSPQYFINDQTPRARAQGEGYEAEAVQEPEPGMVLSRLGGGVQAHAWYFEPYFHTT